MSYIFIIIFIGQQFNSTIYLNEFFLLCLHFFIIIIIISLFFVFFSSSVFLFTVRVRLLSCFIIHIYRYMFLISIKFRLSLSLLLLRLLFLRSYNITYGARLLLPLSSKPCASYQTFFQFVLMPKNTTHRTVNRTRSE